MEKSKINATEEVTEEVAANVDTTAVIRVIADPASPTGYSVIDGENTIHCDKIVPYKGSELVHLPSNSTLRVWISRPKLDAAIEKDGYIELGYKARITLGSNSGAHASWTVPSLAKKYLSEEEVAEMQAILDRAKAAYIAATKKPVTALDKARAAYEKALAKLNALTAAEELAGTTGADNTDAE